MRAKFGSVPMAVSKILSFKFISRLAEENDMAEITMRLNHNIRQCVSKAPTNAESATVGGGQCLHAPRV